MVSNVAIVPENEAPEKPKKQPKPRPDVPRTVLGNLMYQIREERGLSQSALAESMFRVNPYTEPGGKTYDHSYISRVESGKRKPSRQFLFDMVTALNLTETEAEPFYVAGGYVSLRSPFLNASASLLRLTEALARATDTERRAVDVALDLITKGLSCDATA